ncbi:MAG: TolC family protein [Saprospiraceae bacterium]
MKKLLFILVVGFSWSSVSAQTNTFSLQQAIDYAMKNDNSLRNAQLNIKDAAGQIKEIRAIGMPKLSAKVDYQYFIELPTSLIPANAFDPTAPEGQFIEAQFGTSNSLTASLDFSMLLFDGTYLVGLEAAKLYKDFAGLQVKQAEKEVKDKVVDAYVSTLIFEVTKKTFDDNIKNLTGLIKETKELYKEGFAEQLDVDRLEYSLQSIKTELANLNRQEEQVKNLLKFTMSYPLDQDIQLVDNIDMLLVNEFALANDEALDLNNRPELNVLNKSLDLQALDIKQYQRGYLPNLAAFASYQYSVQGNNLFDNPPSFPMSLVGLQLNVPIFDGFEKRAKIERARVSQEKSLNQKKDLVRAINLEVETARISYTNAFERVGNSKKSVELAQKIYDTTKTKYKEGVGSSFELIQAESELYQSQNSYQQALYDYLKSKADLKKALGK